MERPQSLDAIGLALLGLLYGTVVGLLALRLAGAGHGWCSALVSGWGIFVMPVFGIALAYGGRLTGHVLLAITVVGMLSTDWSLLQAARSEETHYLQRVWRSRDGLGLWLLWLLMWLAWQVAVLVAVVREMGRHRSDVARPADPGVKSKS
jgi:hypothetical protein